MTATVAPPNEAAPVTARPQRELRPDIQALRALAVGVVVLYHLWPVRLTGGYVGVDVFFVISGFLITSHLVREVSKTGTIRVGRFWARRAKRLLPASLTVLLVCAVGVITLVPEAQWRQFLREIVAATLYVENWQLAADSVDYLALENAPSPVQHFWTLSVEEQFYIGLPLLLLTALVIVRRRPGLAKTAMATIIGLVLLGSLAFSVFATATSPSVSYFSTLTRAWEFAAGALLAFVTIEAGPRASKFVPLAGVGLIVAAALWYTGEVPFPGVAAALPVVGTLLVLWAGRTSLVSRVGGWRPVATVGHISYAVYLWHWPLIVFVPLLTQRPLSTMDKLVVLALTFGLAWLSTRYIEEPVRFSPRLLGGRRRPRTVALWSVVGMVAVIAVAAGALAGFDQRDRARMELIGSAKADPPSCLGAASMDPQLQPCINEELQGLLIPDPAAAKADDDNLPECWGLASSERAKVCTLNAPDEPVKRVLAVGDSHSNTLIGAYREIAQRHGWHLEAAGMPGCYLTTAQQTASSDSQRAGCERWRAAVMDEIRADPPDAIIVTHSSGDNLVVPPPGMSVEAATVEGMVEAWTSLPDVPIIAIRDNPAMTRDTAACVAANGLAGAEECARPRADAFEHPDGQAEAVSRVPNARLVDLSEFYCTEDVCPPIIGNVLVYRDSRHVTSTWAHTLLPYLEREMLGQLGW